MLATAKELAYSETAFVSKSAAATYKVRFFTVTEEVDLCGHATIATWSLLFKRGLITEGTYTQETLAGKLGIIVSDDGSVFMQQTEPKFLNQVSLKEVMPILRIEEGSFEVSLQPQIVSTGLKDLLVPIRNKEILMNLRPDFGEMSSLSKRYDITGLHVFTLDEESTAIARNFAPLVGIDEESATGTSNGALLCYLQEHGRLKQQDVYRVEQGESMGQLSNILGRFIDGRIWIGGQANLLTEKQIAV
ncbi:MAG: phenazine biosynthesis protein PhzF family [Candidatus Saccharibacteria bacterium]|nr:phenazine biosynthesis protein PhzF family [Candidatus Saccharibacteria bacterium]